MGVLNEWAAECKRIADANGWDDNRTFGDDVALIHSEVSELLEAFRNGDNPAEPNLSNYDWIEKPEGVVSEAVDTMIRIGHMAARYNWDLDSAMFVKMEYNKKRPFRHGGKKL